MTFGGFIALLFGLLFLALILRAFFGGPMGYSPYYDDEEVITTTTTTGGGGGPADTLEARCVGNLRRQYTEGDQPQAYVLDPVDKQKCFLNSKDDYYEDADDKIWRLVG